MLDRYPPAMAKRIRLRISRLISTALHSCTSRDPSILPEDPIPSFSNHRFHGQSSPVAVFKWQEEEKRHVVARISKAHRKICDEIWLPPAPPPSSSDDDEKRTRRGKRKPRRRLSTSSDDSGGTLVSFSTDYSSRLRSRRRMESYAVVKRSEDPLEDFRQSMMEMIVEKQMFDRAELEQLLHCFLSLNSRHYHGVIVEAFSQIWKAVFHTGPASL